MLEIPESIEFGVEHNEHRFTGVVTINPESFVVQAVTSFGTYINQWHGKGDYETFRERVMNFTVDDIRRLFDRPARQFNAERTGELLVETIEKSGRGVDSEALQDAMAEIVATVEAQGLGDDAAVERFYDLCVADAVISSDIDFEELSAWITDAYSYDRPLVLEVLEDKVWPVVADTMKTTQPRMSDETVLKQALEVLKPFIKAGQDTVYCDDGAADDDVWYQHDGAVITFGDFRRAKEVAEQLAQRTGAKLVAEDEPAPKPAGM